jgi:hypothetical protein
MDIQVNKVERTGGRVALVELEVGGVVLGFRAPGSLAYRYRNGHQVLDRDSLYIPRLVWCKAIRMAYGIFGR